LAITVFFLYSNNALAKSDTEDISSSKKHQNLVQLSKKGYLIDISSSDFRRYIEKGPRSFHVILFLTSETQVFPCPSCKILKTEIEKVSKWYKASIKNSEPNLFFVSVELERCREIFENYREKIRQLPQVIYLSPTDSETKFAYKNEDIFPIQQDTIQAIKVAEFVQRKTQIRFDVEHPFDSSPYILGVLIVIMVIYILYKLPVLLARFREPYFWFCAIMCVMAVVYAGMVYNFNNRTPFIHIDSRGIYWLMPGLRSQFVIEGFIMAVILLSGSIAFVFLSKIPEYKKQKRRSLFTISMVFAVGSFFLTRIIFSIKLRGY